VRRKVARVSPDIPVLPAGGIGGADGAREVDALRAAIRGLAVSHDRPRLRARQIAGQLAAEFEMLHETAAEGVRASRLDAEQRAERQTALRAHFARLRAHWHALETEFMGRRQRADAALRSELAGAQAELASALDRDIAHTTDPKGWWEELPFRLRREVVAACRALEQHASKRLRDDAAWLDAQLRGERFAELAAPERTSPELAPPGDVTIDERALDLPNLKRLKIASRVGTGALVIGGSLLLGAPLAIAASISAGIGSEILIDRKVEQQRPALEAAMRERLERALRAYAAGASDRLRAAYEAVAAACAQRLRERERERLAVASETGSAVDWDAAERRIASLRDTIASALAEERPAR
jgi:hypothetical protein